jgi:restriction system protein
MVIPKFEEFLYPFLFQLRNGQTMSIQEMRDALASHFNLSQEDCSLRTKNGSTTQVNDRIGWVRQYLRRAMLIESLPGKGGFRITQRGKDYLSTHKTMSKQDLLQYEEFATFAGVSSVAKSTVKEAMTESVELTPTEQMDNAYKSITEDLVGELLQKILDQTPMFFEHLVVDLLVRMGYGGSFANSAHVTPYVHDDGIDGIIYEDKLGLDKIYIQAKRYKMDNVIGKPQIQQFSGALDEQKSTKGVFITTSSYTKEARSYVEKLNKKIVLIDGQNLAHFMIEYNVGVSTKQVYEIKRVDTDYFEE